MTYTEITSLALIIVVLVDIFGFKTSMLASRAFWGSYAIVLPFQLLTNWWLTSNEIVLYSPDAIIGLRIAGAPIEDLLFGFAMMVGYLSFWVYRNERLRSGRGMNESKTR
jgi:lycopene cyclase domain-containing protein